MVRWIQDEQHFGEVQEKTSPPLLTALQRTQVCPRLQLKTFSVCVTASLLTEIPTSPVNFEGSSLNRTALLLQVALNTWVPSELK